MNTKSFALTRGPGDNINQLLEALMRQDISVSLRRFKVQMKNPAASSGVSECGEEICPKGVTPECFYRGSTLLTTTLSHVEWVGGPDPDSPGFPLKTAGMTDFGLRKWTVTLQDKESTRSEGGT